MNKTIKQLVEFAVKHQLIEKEDEIYCINQILTLMHENSYEDQETLPYEGNSAEPLLEKLIEKAIEKGIIENTQQSKDSFDTRIMNVFMPKPSAIIKTFNQYLKEEPKKASDYFYQLSTSSNYIRQMRVAKDRHWLYESEFGNIDITINLSKPEKAPKDIAAAKNMKSTNYPKCLLCKENVGFSGTLTHPARDNHRIIPFVLDDTNYFMQYSPYVYYNEHCIVFNENHIPMKIDLHTFKSLLDFVSVLPHYFIGSNADLPIVGGSILTHDHFQGGNYEFAMAKAKAIHYYNSTKYPSVTFSKVYWPMSVIRARSTSKEELALFGEDVLNTWIDYSDESQDIIAHTTTRHNTITPIVRIKDGKYEMDLVLRNNRTNDQYPLGIFHPHASKHHIKKENIGLIEVMGLAVLPSRLNKELEIIKDALLNNKALDESLSIHNTWFEHLKTYDLNKDNIDGIIEKEVGRIFLEVLKDAGVFKQSDEGQKAFDQFIEKFV